MCVCVGGGGGGLTCNDGSGSLAKQPLFLRLPPFSEDEKSNGLDEKSYRKQTKIFTKIFV